MVKSATVAAVLIALALSACGATSPHKGNSNAATTRSRVQEQATVQDLYSPFGAGGLAKGVRVAKTVSGYCWTGSIVDPRSDAFRCTVGNDLYDPCFSDELNPQSDVLCPASHPGSKVVKIKLTKKLPSARTVSSPTHYPPWTVRLANGHWCGMIGGATGLIAGMRVNYSCKGGGILLGDPHRNSPAWTIFYAPKYQSSSYRTVTIRQAWW